ncbi:DUF349 domain-containing protein [Georgenia yuyongxinii]|uniref:DUF349 domain-containing protein n=1 Tax=Georgenia yuyongxinii TaxID=2589797 RepID=UPI001E4AF0E9|nr:DUF349 domain-containing protein [Georgenia yuyongxinii]
MTEQTSPSDIRDAGSPEQEPTPESQPASLEPSAASHTPDVALQADTTAGVPARDDVEPPAAAQAPVDTAAEPPAEEPQAPVDTAAVPPAEEPQAPVDSAAVPPAEEPQAPVDSAAVPPAEEPQAPVDSAAEPPAEEPQAPAEPQATVDTPVEPPADEPQAPEEPQASADTTPAAAGPEAVGARPTPRPRPMPRPAPLPHTPAAAAPVAPAAPPVDARDAAEAAAWGRVDDDGTVWVREATGERMVGQYTGADREEALGFYVRRFLDLQAQVALFEARLPQLAAKEIDQTLTTLTEALQEPTAVGDIDGLRARLERLTAAADERRAQAAAERESAKAQAVAERTAIVEQAEKIAAQDPSRTQWKQSGERLRNLLDSWKNAQRNGPRLDRPTEDSLWKRFSHARTAFDRHRRQYFSELDASQAQVKSAKEQLIARAEELSTSTDWARTAIAYRQLMDDWKAAGRAARKDDDALWARFRAAQQSFFDARSAQNAEVDAEYGENLKVKLALLEEAEKLVPVTDVKAAKAALRPLQDKWDAAGKVPRNDVQRVEGRMRAVEQAVRDAEQAAWHKTDPEKKARAEGAAAQLEASIKALEADLAKARDTGDDTQIAEAQAALDARRAWLDQVQRTARD